MKFICSILLLCFTWAAAAQELDNMKKLDQLFDAIESHQKGMGSISIFQDGKEVYSRSIGMASLSPAIKATAKTKYRIGSISKVMTAALIMRMVEEGRLSLDTRLAKFYPEINNAADITVKMMLSHRSGIFNFTNMPNYTSWMEKPISEKELVEKIASLEARFEPGDKYEYSNSNYVLLSFMAEKIGNKPFARLLQEYIYTPCNLQSTEIGEKIEVESDDAQSYIFLEDWGESSETDPSVPLGAGAISSTPADLNTFLTQLFSHKLVSEASLASMMEIQDGYGLGIIEVPFYDKKAYGHTGGIDGFQSNGFYFPQEKVAITYLSNGVVMPLNDILIGALSIYFGLDYEIPSFEVLSLSSEELSQYVGTYSTTNFPLKIKIMAEDETLKAQATGQAAFPLEAYASHQFKFDAAGIKIEFVPQDQKLILRQGGMKYEMQKEE